MTAYVLYDPRACQKWLDNSGQNTEPSLGSMHSVSRRPAGASCQLVFAPVTFINAVIS